MQRLWWMCGVMMVCAACGGKGAQRGDEAQDKAVEVAAPTQGAGFDGVYKLDHIIELMSGEEGIVLDCAEVKLRADGTLQFGFTTVQTKEHECGMSGVAKPSGEPNTWRHVPTEQSETEGEEPCVLDIRVTDRSIDFIDVTGTCREYWCSARASIDTTRFDRAWRTEDTSCK
jgi:hypothetical protein